MKKNQLLALFLIVSGSTVTFQTRADTLAGSGDPFSFSFDENGNGELTNGGVVTTITGMLAPDPTQAGNPLELTYLLPGPMVNGEVRVWDDAAGTILSDLLCFTDAAGDLTGQTADRLIFYSTIGGGELADTGIPPNLVLNDGGGTVEAADGSFLWAPGGPGDNMLFGISEVVPEPGTLVLLGLGAGSLLLARRRHERS